MREKFVDDSIKELLERACTDLMEYGNAVQILVSVVDDEGMTYCHKQGIGDYYARIGMAHELIEKGRHSDQAHMISQAMKEDDL